MELYSNMRCPFCGNLDDKVVDSRISKTTIVIRRRRECLFCKKRFTTHEKIKNIDNYVIKKNGSLEIYNSNKIKTGMLKALHKRPISLLEIENFINKLELNFRENGIKEIPVQKIGNFVVNELKKIDKVAYIRFTSIYNEFHSIEEFIKELKQFLY